MPRLLIAVAIACAMPLAAGIWPEQLWDLKRSAVKSVTPPDLPVWQEYGLEAAEQAEYPGFKATGYRLKDPTNALAVYQWLKPAGGRQTKLEKIGVEFDNRVFLLKGNYVLDFDGRLPTQQQLDILHVQLARLDQSALPSLPGYLPATGLVPSSERYIIGPTSLDKFLPGVAPSVAAFSSGAEGQLAAYQSPKGPVKLAIFSYPTPQMARERAVEFQKIPGTVVKRTGPLVALTLGSPSADESERLLAKVNYQATVTLNEAPAGPPQNPGDMLLNIFILIGILVAFTVFAGVGYAAIRIGWRRLTGQPDDEPMVSLRIGEK
ncbi:MAG: DUF6599 family protein [Bryobacteraceae bacterium]